MTNARNRAVRTYRAKLNQKGMARFEVLGRDRDRDLIRSLARRLAEGGPETENLRASLERGVAGASAIEPEARQRLGTALSEIGRKNGLTNADVEALERARAAKPAEPMRFE